MEVDLCCRKLTNNPKYQSSNEKEFHVAKLISITDYRTLRFVDGSAPDIRTLKKLIDDGKLSGKKLGKKYYVLVDDYLNEFNPLEMELMNHG